MPYFLKNFIFSEVFVVYFYRILGFHKDRILLIFGLLASHYSEDRLLRKNFIHFNFCWFYIIKTFFCLQYDLSRMSTADCREFCKFRKLFKPRKPWKENTIKIYFSLIFFRGYIRSYDSHSLKKIYDVNTLDLVQVAKSFGFPTPPFVDLPVSNKPKVKPLEANKKRKNDGQKFNMRTKLAKAL